MGTGGYLNYRDTNNGAVAWASTTNKGNLTAMPATFPNVASYDIGASVRLSERHVERAAAPRGARNTAAPTIAAPRRR